MLTLMLWEYAKRQDPTICRRLEEPVIGNPPGVYDEGKLISADLSNSILEFISTTEGLPAIKNDSMIVTELGGGYGRTAFVFLNLNPRIKYIMVDLPLSLWTAQNYLSQVF